ncbi:MAG TPA: helix-turn-helix transcriptional regulator [Clostridia bacterium]|nr:helix-turn-helix transcriptional regulator [Clostridia bacterium]
MQEFSKRLKELRIENGYSQTDFGKLLNVSQDTISLWERDKSYPTTDCLYKICKTFSISADYLLGLDKI